MRVVVFVEGKSDTTTMKRILAVLGQSGIPVRAGYADFQGQALLSGWRSVVRFAREDKVVFIFDSDKEDAVRSEVARGRSSPVPGLAVVMLARPWRGNEDFVGHFLDQPARARFHERRAARAPKKALAETSSSEMSEARIRADGWIQSTLVPVLSCSLPAEWTIGGIEGR